MVILCDTSVLVPALIEEHAHHSLAFSLIQKIRGGEFNASICAHTLAECYASITAIPGEEPIQPAQAWDAIEKHIIPVFQVIELVLQDYQNALQAVVRHNLKSGVVYDALILQAAIKKKIKHLVTWNKKHFEQLSQGEIQISTPESFA